MSTATMPTLCGLAGPLPEIFRPFINPEGELQVGDAYGLEAQWIIGLITSQPSPEFPEDEWSCSQIEEDELGTGCAECGDEEADTIRSLCWHCR